MSDTDGAVRSPSDIKVDVLEKPKIKSEDTTDAEPEPEPETKPEVEPEPEPEPESKPEPEKKDAEPKPEPEKRDAEPEPEPEPEQKDAEAEAKADAEAESDELEVLIKDLDALISDQQAMLRNNVVCKPEYAGGAADRDKLLENVQQYLQTSKTITKKGAAELRKRIEEIKMNNIRLKSSKFTGNITKALMAIKSVVEQFKSTDPIIAFAIIASLVFMITAALLSFGYMQSINIARANTILIKNPLNTQSTDFSVARSASGSIFNSSYPYVIFLWFPVAILLCVAIVFARIWFLRSQSRAEEAKLQGVIITGLCIAIVYGVITMILNYFAYFYGARQMKLVSNRIRDFNKKVHSRLYNNNRVLSSYTQVQSNAFLIMDTIKSVIKHVPTKTSATDLAKFLYTTNFYLHFHKIGMRNPLIVPALQQFSFKNVLRIMNFSPADYLFRRSTYIEDYSESIASTFRRMNSKIPEDTFTEAIILTSEWIADANNRANSFYAEDAIIPFYKMAIIMAISNSFPFFLATWIFRDPMVRQQFFDFMSSRIMK